MVTLSRLFTPESRRARDKAQTYTKKVVTPVLDGHSLERPARITFSFLCVPDMQIYILSRIAFHPLYI